MGIFGGGQKSKTRSSEKFNTTETISRLAPSTFTIGAQNLGKLQLTNGLKGLRADVDLGNRRQDRADDRFDATNLEQKARIEGDIRSLRGDNSALINARLNPLRASIASQRGTINRSLSRRNVAGSLANNEITRFNESADRQLGDAAAIAERENLSAILEAEGQLAGLNQNELKIANTEIQRQLAKLGISLEALGLSQRNQQFVTGRESSGTRTGTSSTRSGSSPGIGNLVTAASSFF